MCTKYEMLLGRARVMLSAGGLLPELDDKEILERTKGETLEQKLQALEGLTSLVPRGYWQKRGL
jgi:hypothetical protein